MQPLRLRRRYIALYPPAERSVGAGETRKLMEKVTAGKREVRCLFCAQGQFPLRSRETDTAAGGEGKNGPQPWPWPLMSHGSTSVARTSDRLDEHPGTGRGKTIECTIHPPCAGGGQCMGGGTNT